MLKKLTTVNNVSISLEKKFEFLNRILQIEKLFYLTIHGFNI